jgi:uncharacterized membrane protein
MNIMFAQAILQKESKRCGFVTGHDFSRAAKCLKIKVGFSPCGIFPFHYRFLSAPCRRLSKHDIHLPKML